MIDLLIVFFVFVFLVMIVVIVIVANVNNILDDKKDDYVSITHSYPPTTIVQGGWLYDDPSNSQIQAAAPYLYRELRYLVQTLEPLERDGELKIPGLVTLDGARQALDQAHSGWRSDD